MIISFTTITDCTILTYGIHLYDYEQIEVHPDTVIINNKFYSKIRKNNQIRPS